MWVLNKDLSTADALHWEFNAQLDERENRVWTRVDPNLPNRLDDLQGHWIDKGNTPFEILGIRVLQGGTPCPCALSCPDADEPTSTWSWHLAGVRYELVWDGSDDTLIWRAPQDGPSQAHDLTWQRPPGVVGASSSKRPALQDLPSGAFGNSMLLESKGSSELEQAVRAIARGLPSLSKAEISKILYKPGHLTMRLFHEGEFVAAVTYVIRDVLIEVVFLVSTYRCRGFGSKLLQHVHDIGAAYGIRTTVLKGSFTALSFFQKCGYMLFVGPSMQGVDHEEVSKRIHNFTNSELMVRIVEPEPAKRRRMANGA